MRRQNLVVALLILAVATVVVIATLRAKAGEAEKAGHKRMVALLAEEAERTSLLDNRGRTVPGAGAAP